MVTVGRSSIAFLIAAVLLVVPTITTAAKDPFPLIVVDKSKNKLYLASYNQSQIILGDAIHATLGKMKGDKQIEKDLKTPEGIYFFTNRIEPPALARKFGVLALKLNYPNPIDEMSGKTGYAIMLHATDDPDRLNRDLDSEGCVVISNEQIKSIARTVHVGLTPILIYDELKSDFLKADAAPKVKEAFEKWLHAWSGKDIDSYAASYSPEFTFNGMNLKAYKDYKKNLNQKYASIDVRAENVRFYHHPKYDVVTFTQLYDSALRGGGKGFHSAGTKTLYFNKDDQIVVEDYSNLKEN